MNKLIKLNKTEKILYIIGLVLFLIILLTKFVFDKYQIHIVNYIKPCPIRQVTGYYCPGCGGTRAFDYLLTGSFLTSAYYNPILIYSVLVYATFMISNTLQIVLDLLEGFTGRILIRKRIGMIYRDAYLWICLFIIILNFIVKNILVLFHIHLIG